MSTKMISNAPGGGRTVSGLGKGDPRPGMRKAEGAEQRTLKKFDPNPFKNGGSMEQPDEGGQKGTGPEPGPAGGRKLKAQPITDKSSDKEVGKKFGRTEAGSRVRVGR